MLFSGLSDIAFQIVLIARQVKPSHIRFYKTQAPEA